MRATKAANFSADVTVREIWGYGSDDCGGDTGGGETAEPLRLVERKYRKWHG